MLPGTARVWEYLQRVAQDLFSRYGYEPVYTPMFEHTDVFTRGIGEATDIVSKEMYTFEDKGGRSITLRPEGTASVVRASLEHNLTANGAQAKLYYAGPMFRYERPQKGRMRQFWQIGIEVLGAAEPTADAEVITVLWRYFEALGIPAASMRLLLNTMGDQACRPAYREKVASYIREHADGLCEECNRRAETNPLRAFDCKNASCAIVMASAPLLRDELCDDCAAHYAAVKTHLDGLGIPYIEEPKLVRGLDYYTRTVFEILPQREGGQSAIVGGGRYDGLIEQIGGRPTPGVGFATGIERIILNLREQGLQAPPLAAPVVYLAHVGEAARRAAVALAATLRSQHIGVLASTGGRSLKAQLRQANSIGVCYTIILGDDEVQRGEAVVRDMAANSQATVSLDSLPAHLGRS